MTEHDLIYDDGELRNCAHNMAIIGFLGTFRNFFSYKKCFNTLLDFNILGELKEAAISVIAYIFVVVLFPILPLIQAFLTYKRAKAEVEKQLVLRACGQLFDYKKSKTHNV